MKLAWILWLASVLPPQTADSLCLSTTVYLEARDQSVRGQKAVAEVALRRRENGRWGESTCDVVTAPKQFAPTLVNPGIQEGGDIEAWTRAINVALTAQKDWQQPVANRNEVVPGASHFVALSVAQPSWRNKPLVATIGDHTFLRVDRL